MAKRGVWQTSLFVILDVTRSHHFIRGKEDLITKKQITDMPSNSSFIRLSPFVQPSPYGKKGSNSVAARFATATRKDFEIDEDQPYGEARPYDTKRVAGMVLIGTDVDGRPSQWNGAHTGRNITRIPHRIQS